MGSRYLTDLDDVVRGAGIAVQLEPGWETRARGSGGYNSGLPNHVMAHHTASGPSSDGQPDVDYMCYGSDNRPVANLYLSRSGKVWVMAAGATNTNGSGSDPCGATANDSMNSSAIGIEAANNGVGETWPTIQQDTYLRLVGALCDHYGIPVGRTHAHFEWAPGRKIDPAGQSRYASGSASWNMNAFRGDVSGGAPLPPPEGTDDMLILFRCTDAKSPGVHYRTNGVHYTVIADGADESALVWFMTLAGATPTTVQTCTKSQIGFAGIYLDIGTGQPRANPYL